MIPTYNDHGTVNEKSTTPGSFSVNKVIPIQDSLEKIIKRVANEPIPENATISEVEDISRRKLLAKDAEIALQSLHNESNLKQPLTQPPTRRDVDGIQHPLKKTVATLQIGNEQQAEQIVQLEKRIASLEAGINNIGNEEKITQPEIIHIPQSETSSASAGNLLPNFSERQIAQSEIIPEIPAQIEMPQPLPVITSETINEKPEKPSELSKVRSSRLIAKIPAPRLRLINGKIHEERMATLLKPETPPDDFIDKTIEVIAPNIDLHIEQAVEKIIKPDYKIIVGLAEKLVINKEGVLKIFHNMFSETPTPVKP